MSVFFQILNLVVLYFLKLCPIFCRPTSIMSIYKRFLQHIHLVNIIYLILYPQDRFYTTYSYLSETLVFFLVLYGLAILVSIYGNLLVLWIVKTTRALRNVNNLLVSNLAITDIIIATICTPLNFHAALVQRWDLPEFMCKVLPFVQNMCVNVQILNLILIAKDRYVLYRIFF